MPTQILDCEAIGTNDAWTNVGGANKIESVRRPDDDATSMISTSTINNKQSFYLDAAPSGAESVISNVDTFRRTRENGADSAIACRTIVILGASTTNGTPDSPTGTTFLNTTETAWARPGGGTWTTADFPGGSAGTELGVEETTDSANSIQVTTLYMTITFNYVAGGFVMFLQSMLPPLIAAASHGMGIDQIAAFYKNLKLQPNSREELEALQRALLRRPKFAFPR